MKPLYTEEQFNQAKNKEKLLLECYNCFKSFLRAKSEIISVLNKNTTAKKAKGTGKFCSQKCNGLFNSPPILVNCTQCGKEFKKLQNQIKKTKNNFCCSSCAASYNNTHKTKGYRRSKLEIYLEENLNNLYPDIEIHYNKKDAINSELDIYIPFLRLAFELNGIFHYEPIYGPEKLSKMQNNDERKFQACLEKGIELCIINTSKQKYIIPKTSKKYLDIIINIINSKLQ